MCTLIVAWRVFDDAPVCVAANRDEATDRPSSPPRVREGDRPVLAPRDERAGGTW
ncbi:MAG: NRDE family protein, partial [Natronomonas sp.]|nr:NRDE family protein [Natronomonas sp.]